MESRGGAYYKGKMGLATVLPPFIRLGRSRCRSIGLFRIATASALLALPAQAEFYNLDGRYECLASPDKVCYDATPSVPEPPADEAKPEGGAEAPPPGKPGKPSGKTAAKAAPESGDPLQAIATRLQARKPETGDLDTLKTHAKTGDVKALEMLAWCSFVGVGVPRDPVRAYFLYGQAAAAGAPTGRDSQKLIFEKVLSPSERQLVLQIENGERPAPGN